MMNQRNYQEQGRHMRPQNEKLDKTNYTAQAGGENDRNNTETYAGSMYLQTMDAQNNSKDNFQTNLSYRQKEQANLQKARAELIQSVAEEEKAIAEILMVEAKKLTRAIQQASLTEMNATNTSVQQTLKSIIDLEHVLLEKLELTMGQCLL